MHDGRNFLSPKDEGRRAGGHNDDDKDEAEEEEEEEDEVERYCSTGRKLIRTRQVTAGESSCKKKPMKNAFHTAF